MLSLKNLTEPSPRRPLAPAGCSSGAEDNGVFTGHVGNALAAPQSCPRQFGVPMWLYMVDEYQANGQPLEYNEPGGNRPASI